MEGYNVFDLADGSEPIEDLNVKREIRVEGTKNIDFNPFPLA